MSQTEVMGVLKAHAGKRMTSYQVAEELHLSYVSAQYSLRTLHRKGCIERDDAENRGRYTYWVNNGIR
jgi:predicted transcriptional regulator